MDDWLLTCATFQARYTCEHWVLQWHLKTSVFTWNKGFLRVLNWLVGLEINNNSCTTSHAHIWNEKMGIHKKQVYGTYSESKCGKGNIDPIHTCIPTILWNRWLLDCKESMSCQCRIQNEIPIYRILRLHMWWALWNIYKHQIVIILMVTDVTQEDVINYSGTWDLIMEVWEACLWIPNIF